MMSIADRIATVIAKLLKIERERIKPEATFVKDLGADSLTIVELVLAMEVEFGFSIPDEQAEKIVTVGDAIRFIEANADKIRA